MGFLECCQILTRSVNLKAVPLPLAERKKLLASIRFARDPLKNYQTVDRRTKRPGNEDKLLVMIGGLTSKRSLSVAQAEEVWHEVSAK